MKRLLLFLIILISAATVLGQKDLDTFFNDQAASDASADELMSAETPGLNMVPGYASGTSDDTPDTDLTMSAEGSYSEYSKKISIPLSYRLNEFSFRALIPYFLSKESPGDFSVSGIGDISMGISYSRYFEIYSTYLDGNVTVKMPTGDPEAMDGAAPIPLGTDTWDIAGMLSVYYFRETFTYRGSLLYKYNGELETKGSYWDDGLQQDINYTKSTDAGDLFIIEGGLDYQTSYRLTFSGDISYGIRFDNSTEEEYSDGAKTEYEDGKTVYADISPALKYPYSLFEFVLGARIPVYTDVPGNDSNDGTRSVEVKLRTSYRIF